MILDEKDRLRKLNLSSVAQILQRALQGNGPKGPELDLHDEAKEEARGLGFEPRGSLIPLDLLLPQHEITRALNLSSAPAGGFTVQTSVLIDRLVSYLSNKMMTGALGSTLIPNLSGGSVVLPRVTGYPTVSWTTESGSPALTDTTFGQIACIPHRVTVNQAVTRELLFNPGLEDLLRGLILKAIAVSLDYYSLNGTGGAYPRGLFLTTGVGTETFGGATTLAKVIDFETQVANASADFGKLGFLTTPNVRAKWRQVPKVATYPEFLWESAADPTWGGTVLGYRAEVSKNIAPELVVFGNWADLLITMWGAADVVVDVYSQKKSGMVEISLNLFTDATLLHPPSFVISTDAGNQ